MKKNFGGKTNEKVLVLGEKFNMHLLVRNIKLIIAKC